MPELPEVETVKRSLQKLVLNEKICNINIKYNKILENIKIEDFKNKISNQTIHDIKRRGKWLMFELDNYYLLSHLRMEGKYLIRNNNDIYTKHELIGFDFISNKSLRYQDTRKFGRMYLLEKETIYQVKPLNELGLEPWDDNLNISYLKNKYKNKKLPIKTVLLDQTIIVGIGNIYADEILYMSNINPLKKCSLLTNKELDSIIKNTRIILNKAIELGGTTIMSYESSEGVHGRFQNCLLVHGKKKCPKCNNDITKIKVNGRGTYYCSKCQQNV